MVRHVYHLRPGRLLAFLLVWLFAVLLLLSPVGAALTDPAETRALLLTSASLTLVMLPFVAVLWRARLVLTPDGIVQHQFGYVLRSAWANLESLCLDPGIESVRLSQPGSRSLWLRYSVTLLSRAPRGWTVGGDPVALAEGRLILFASFLGQRKRSALREDLLRWAPQLFDAAGNPKPDTAAGRRGEPAGRIAP